MQLGLDTQTTFAPFKVQEGPISPSKRKAKIFCHKLPGDFFGGRIYANSQQKKRPVYREEIQTQRILRKTTLMPRGSETRQIGVRQGSLTSRVGRQPPNTMNLIMGIIQSSRSMNKQIYRNSLQLKKGPTLVSNPESLAFELPPLVLRKGISLN